VLSLPRGDRAVISDSPEAHRAPALAPAVAEVLGVPVADAARRVLRSRGILFERIAAPAAGNLAADLRSRGCAVRVLPMAALPEPPDPIRLTGLSFAEEGLVARLRAGGSATAPWDRPVLAALARFPFGIRREVTVREEPGPGAATAALAGKLFVGVSFGLDEGREVQKVVERTEDRALVDILLDRPRARWRIQVSAEEGFDFSGLGPAKRYAPLENLRTLLAALAAALPDLPLGPGARLLLDRGRLSTLGYREAGDLDREVRWLAALAEGPAA
jgi:hypothetical protein